jgi:hypothetical protein
MATQLLATPESFKKVIVPLTELPLIRFTTNLLDLGVEEIDKLYYDFRYRIVSEDKSRTSAWSPIERVNMIETGSGKNSQGISYFPYTSDERIQVSSSRTLISVVWSKPKIQSQFESIFNKTGVYDVWVRLTTEDNANASSTSWLPWKFVTTTSSDGFSIVEENSSYQTIEVAIQVPSETKVRDYRNNKVTLYRKIAPLELSSDLKINNLEIRSTSILPEKINFRTNISSVLNAKATGSAI